MMPLGWAAIALELVLQRAWAGCTVDAEGDTRRAAAGLVVGGTVVHRTVLLHEDGRTGTVRHLVRVDRTWKGKVTSGHLVLETRVGGGTTCPPDIVFNKGQKVYAIGSPEDGQTLYPSFCTKDVGPWREGTDDWLSDTAHAKSDTQGRTYPGASSSWPAVQHIPLPKGGPQHIRVANPGPVGVTEGTAAMATPVVAVEGQVLRTGIMGVQALFPLAEMELALWVGKDTLSRAPLREVELVADGEAEILVRPGAPLALGERKGDGFVAKIEEGGLSAAGWVSENDLGTLWTAQPPLEPLDNPLDSPLSLHASPAGKVVAELAGDAGLTWEATGPERQGWLPVRIHGVWIRAEGWMQPKAAGGGVTLGEGLGGGAAFVLLDPKVDLRAPDDGQIFGRITSQTLVTELFAGPDWAYVAVDTPWGPMPAEVWCRAPLETSCQRR